MWGKKILNFSIIAISFTVLMLAFVAVAPPVFAHEVDDEVDDDCTTTVTAPDSIQTAVDDASLGDVVCLDDSGGAFAQQVVFDSSDSGITLRAADDSSPVLDGSTLTGSTTISAIELFSGVSDITIRGLEIKNYEGDSSGNDRSSGILAASGTTSGVSIRNNNIHDNFWNGVLVFSSGNFVHDDWEVEDNTVEDNGFVGIELTNCNDCEIEDNEVHDSGFANIVIQARNTNAGSGLVTIEGVEVDGNNISSSLFGIYILSLTSNFSFNPISGASTVLTDVSVEENTITDSTVSGIRFWAFNNAATAENSEIEENTINCITGAGDKGIEILERGLSGESGTVIDMDLEDNIIDSDCDPAIIDESQTIDEEIELNGTIDSISDPTFGLKLLNGTIVPILTDGNTEFKDGLGGFSDLTVELEVEVEAVPSNGGLLATEIELEEEE